MASAAASNGSRHAVSLIRRVLWGQRCYSSSGGASQTTTVKVSRFAALDARIERALPGKMRALWSHPAGLKTIHFWAPTWKWCLVFAGMADYARPPENLSPRQSGALAATGIIWARYSMVIIPKNYNLFSVNFFLALTGLMQLSRYYLYRKSLKESDLEGCPLGHDAAEGGARPGFSRSGGNVENKDHIRFGPPIMTDPGEGFGPPGSGPPSAEEKK